MCSTLSFIIINTRSSAAPLDKIPFSEFKGVHDPFRVKLAEGFCSRENEVISPRGKISRKDAYLGGLGSHWDLLTPAE